MKNYKVAQLLHNPGAGSESTSKKELEKMLEITGWKILYSSTKESWDIHPEAEVLIVSGGDGTVRKAAVALMDLSNKPVVALLPFGTANNIAGSLKIPADPQKVIEGWLSPKARIIDFDAGTANHPAVSDFFIEGVGFGIFPKMISQMMKNAADGHATPEDNLAASLEEIYEVAGDYEPVNCKLIIDGKDFSDEMLMVEILNIPSIGPRLLLAPDVNFSDGLLDIVIATPKNRKQLEKYFKHKIKLDTDNFTLPVIKGKDIRISWNGPDFHLDDALIELEENSEMRISIHREQLKFLLPG